MFRISTIDDCKYIHELICDMENSKLQYEAFSEIFKSQHYNPDYECIVYEENNRILGFVNLRYEYQLHHVERIAEIMEFVVCPDYRDRCLGKKLFNEACNAAQRKSCTQIEVACNQLRTNTHRFYQVQGMNNFHYKFSKRFMDDGISENYLGR